MLFKPQFKGVALLAHGVDTGMSNCDLARWKRELADIKAMGADTIWYCPIQFCRCSSKDFNERSAFMRRQIGIHKAALDAGLKVGLFLGLNDIFQKTLDAHPRWRADKSTLFLEGGEVCPSIPAAWAEVMSLREKLFAMLPRIDHLFVPPTDYGGCSCAKCAPWAEQYLRLFKEQAAQCRRHHPGAKMVATGYCMRLDQVDLVREGLKSADWVDYVVDVPRGCGKGVIKFYMAPEITMLRGWGVYGASPVLEKIRRLYRSEGESVIGVMPYSEGIHDDVNRFACLAFAANPGRSCVDVATEYAVKWLGLPGNDANRVASVILGLDRPYRPEAYLDPDKGMCNPLADRRVKVLMNVRERHPALDDNYRYWLLQYCAVTQAFDTVEGTLDVGTLCAEAENCRVALLKLEPEYGRFLTEKVHLANRVGLQPWIWKRTFHAAWERERRFECACNKRSKTKK